MINGINHTAIATPDLDRLVAFYRDVMGFEPCSRFEWDNAPMIDQIIGVPGSAAKTVMLRAGNAYLEFFQYRSPATESGGPARQPFHQGYTHICLDVTDIDAELARLTAAGAVFQRLPPRLPESGLAAVYGRDPDGNIIELMETFGKSSNIVLTDLPMVRTAGAGEAADRDEITRKIHLYCRAIDRCDEELLRSLFHPDAEHRHGPYHGPSSEFCGFALTLVAELAGTAHHLSNVVIDLDGAVAHTEAYFLASHRLARGTRCTGIFASHDPDRDELVQIGGRYIDRWERRLGVWKIARRTGVHDWEHWSAGDARGLPMMPADQKGARDRSDPVYRRD